MQLSNEQNERLVRTKLLLLFVIKSELTGLAVISVLALVLFDSSSECCGDLCALAAQDDECVAQCVDGGVTGAISSRLPERPRVSVHRERLRELARLDAKKDAVLCWMRD